MLEGQRIAFELLKRDGLSLVEAAEILGIGVGAVKVRAHRAYEAIRAVLREGRGDGASPTKPTDSRGAP
jgi:RNA polymerase sigma-70 factor (ECF subfamily)